MAYRGAPKQFYGWKDDGKYFLSIEPRGVARNEYGSSQESLREASRRGRAIVWEKPEDVD